MPMSERELASLIRKNAAKAEQARSKTANRRKYDDTLPVEEEQDDERKMFFKEMKKREF